MLLLENRIKRAKEKYNNQPLTDTEWQKIIKFSSSISPNHKYLDWIVKVFIDMVGMPSTGVQEFQTEEFLTKIINLIKSFEKVKNKLDKKDLYSYKSFSDLKKSLDGVKRVIDTHHESEVVYEDDRFKVVVPQSHAASCYYGAGTKWCTAAKDSDNQFKNYNREGKLFYILDKSLPTSNRFYKIALNKTYLGKNEFYDAPDDPIFVDDINYIVSSPIMDAINSYFQYNYAEEIEKISEEEKQRELERQSRDNEWAERRRQRIAELNAQAELRKQLGEWDMEDPTTIGEKANALMDFLIYQGDWNDNEEEIENIKDAIDNLRSEMENDPEVIENPSGEAAQDYGEDLNNLEDELNELIEDKPTVYDIFYDERDDYGHYGLTIFEYDGAEYAVGDDDEADEAAFEQVRQLIDDIGYEGFSTWAVERHVDGDMVADYMYEWIEEDVRNEPEIYLSDDDRELNSEAEKEIELLEEEIGELEESLEDMEEDWEIEETEDRIYDLQEKIEEIEEDDDNYEWSEEALDSAIEGRLEEIRNDPIRYIEDYELDISNFIDEDDFVESVVNDDGRGNSLSSYDGEEYESDFNDTTYYIYRTN